MMTHINQQSTAAAPLGRPRVAIVGAGFGGLSVVRALAGSGLDVLLLDCNNYHGFWPLLYQVATAGFVHLIYLIGFRNRLIVLANWAYNYFTYDRGVRLITGDH